jgi:hypothetical protein
MSQPACPFYVGQKVACKLPQHQIAGWARALGIKEGGVYTIREICIHPGARDVKNEAALKFIGIHRKPGTDGTEYGFYHKHFRPVTDISSLESLLKTTKLPEDERTPEHA